MLVNPFATEGLHNSGLLAIRIPGDLFLFVDSRLDLSR